MSDHSDLFGDDDPQAKAIPMPTPLWAVTLPEAEVSLVEDGPDFLIVVIDTGEQPTCTDVEISRDDVRSLRDRLSVWLNTTGMG